MCDLENHFLPPFTHVENNRTCYYIYSPVRHYENLFQTAVPIGVLETFLFKHFLYNESKVIQRSSRVLRLYTYEFSVKNPWFLGLIHVLLLFSTRLNSQNY